MTPEELTAIRERANNATPGPWEPTQETLTHPSGYEIESPDTYIASECCGYTGSVDREADAVFIAQARTDIPNLLDHVDTLTARLAAIRKQLLGTEDEIGLLEADFPVEDGSEFQDGAISGYKLAVMIVRAVIDGD